MDEQIPNGVLEALEEVRASGETNMYDRDAAICLAQDFGNEEAADWLQNNSDRYMEALIAMGKQRVA